VAVIFALAGHYIWRRTQVVDAGTGPEIYQHHLPAQRLGRKGEQFITPQKTLLLEDLAQP